MKTQSKRTAGPWQVVFLQTASDDRRSRPVVRDLRGNKIGNKAADAVLMGASPELLELAASLLQCVEMQAMQIASALALSSVQYPLIVAEAKELLRRLSSQGVRP